MGVLLQHHNAHDNFTQISNVLLRDSRISMKARGVLCQVRSHTAGWVTSERHLVTTSKEGRTAIRSALAELEEHGYLHRETIRNDDGTIKGSTWHTTDDPLNSPIPVFKSPRSGFQTVGNETLKNTNKQEHQHFNNTTLVADQH